MNQKYKMKVSFDNINWYQCEWNDVDFNEVIKAGETCNDISDLDYELHQINPNSNLQYSFLGNDKTKRTRGSKNK